MRSQHRQRPLTVEPLEDRVLLSGNVRASVVDGDLRIIGDNNPNGVWVFQVKPQVFRVIGLRAGGEPTMVNGRTSVRLRGVVDDFFVNLRDDNDLLRLGRRASQTSVPDASAVLTGSGDDRVIARNFSSNGRAYCQLGDGNDRLVIKECAATKAVLKTGAGNDVMLLESDNFARVAKLYTEGGSDRVRINLSHANRFRAYLGDGNDRLLVGSSSTRYIPFADGGSGWDLLRETAQNRGPDWSLANFERVALL